MTKKQYLLQKLQEECAEVILAASKYSLFGPESKNPLDANSRTNRQHLADEIVDVMALTEMIGMEDMLAELTPNECGKQIEAKIAKVEHYMKASRELGILEQEPLEVVPATD